MFRVSTLLRTLLVGGTLAIGFGVLTTTSVAEAQNKPATVSCRTSALRETLSTNEKSFTPGTTVVMRLVLRNVGSRACTIAVGPTSPSLTILNAKDKVIWNNCYAGDQPGACAMFLMLRTIEPDTSYTLSKSWNQRTGLSNNFAARGRYVLTSNVSGLGAEKKVAFSLVA
jgi:ABC-type transport system substrate-binding protein